MPDPIALGVVSGLSAAASAIVTSSKFIYDLKNTPVDVKTCLDLVHRVDADINFAMKLRDRYLDLLAENPGDLKRLDQIIATAEQSILDIGRLLEGCRAEVYGGHVPLKGRMRWVLGDSAAFKMRTGNLQQQHNTILHEITYLRTLDGKKCLKELRPNTTFENWDPIIMRREESPDNKDKKQENHRPEEPQPPPAYASTLPLVPAVSDPRPHMKCEQLSYPTASTTWERDGNPRPTNTRASTSSQPVPADEIHTFHLQAQRKLPYPADVPFTRSEPSYPSRPLAQSQSVYTPSLGDIPPTILPGFSQNTTSSWRSPEISATATPATRDRNQESQLSVSRSQSYPKKTPVGQSRVPYPDTSSYSDLIPVTEPETSFTQPATSRWNPPVAPERPPKSRSSYSSYSSTLWLYPSPSGSGSSVQSPQTPHSAMSQTSSSYFPSLENSIAPEVVPDLYTLPSVSRSTFTLGSRPADDSFQSRSRSGTQHSWAASTDTLVSRPVSRPSSATPSEWQSPLPSQTWRLELEHRRASSSTSQCPAHPASPAQEDRSYGISSRPPDIPPIDEDPQIAFFQGLKMVEEERRQFREERRFGNS